MGCGRTLIERIVADFSEILGKSAKSVFVRNPSTNFQPLIRIINTQ